MVDIPGRRQPVAGARLQGQQADGLVTRIALGVVSLVAELRGHERQAAEELDQWNTSHEAPEPLDGSPAPATSQTAAVPTLHGASVQG